LSDAGYETWEELAAMLAEFSLLEVFDAAHEKHLWIDAGRAALDADPDWIRDYSSFIKKSLSPVGGYSHMGVMFGSDSVFYGGYDREFGPLGSSVQEVVDGLFCMTPPVRLSMIVE